MPLYRIVTCGVDLDDGQRLRLVQGLSSLHHDETLAPEPFQRVAFFVMPPGSCYDAGALVPLFALHASLRAGRSSVTRGRIARRCLDLISDVTALTREHILVTVSETPAPWLMAAGLVLPEPDPDAEARWLLRLQQLYPGRYDRF